MAVSASQLGFCLALLLIEQIGDLLENHQLLLALVRLQVVAMFGVAMATSGIGLLRACLFVGITVSTDERPLRHPSIA
ncbi:hypothetical protein M2D07_004795 [Pseudomonas sp. BGr12]|uniref:hypothetical protein n=1 Tax=Pseudomonas sp. BGr12 TaxID=2936269 RepID=UPI002559C867|nr:hypothetical protein [Pseudomonas sp. BJa5]MDL2426331.1 hypothetical protein [Pseudomonas sp. BJa5]